MKVAVILSGCGFMDGAEIHESVLTLFHLEKIKAKVNCFAPDIPQTRTVNHLDNRILNETRNVLAESARIARGNIKNLNQLNVDNFDALILPGGFGAAVNLSDFADKGSNAKVDPLLDEIILKAHVSLIPIGAICIAPALIARILGKFSPILTIGNDEQTASELEKMGAKHRPCHADEIAVDEENSLVSTPAYMLAENIFQVYTGIESLVRKIQKMVTENKVSKNP